MAKDLLGKKIAIGASRKTEEFCALIEKQGGVPFVRSLQGTVFLAEEKVEHVLMKVIQEGIDWAIFTTGIGIETLLNIADKLSVKGRFLDTILQAKTASRGYKSLSTLKKLGVTPLAMDRDGTTRTLIEALEGHDFKGQRVMVQLHGESAPKLIQFLEGKGAVITVVLPYEHIAPQKEVVTILCEELVKKEMDAVCFTTATQVRALFDIARQQNCMDEILTAFKTSAVAAAVGKVTAEALREEGIERIVVPENERMGAMVLELARFFKHNRD